MTRARAARALRSALLVALCLQGLAACAPKPASQAVPEATLGPLVARAERARQLRALGPVRLGILPSTQVQAVLESELDRAITREELRRDTRTKQVLGLLPAGVDLRAALLGFQSEAVVGFYSPLARRLYVVGDASLGVMDGTQLPWIAVHEIVHALQDMHFQLLDVTSGLIAHDDLAFALGALLEGDAVLAEMRDEAEQTRLPVVSPAAYAAQFEVMLGSVPGTPRLLHETFLRQYPAGYALATQLVEGGGIPALDAALRDPPVSSEQVLHPERYVEAARREPLLLFAVQPEQLGHAGCDRVGENGFGELGLQVWASEAGADAEAAARAADGWDGDRAWVLDCAPGVAFAWLVEFEDAAEAGEFAALARELPWVGDPADLLGPARVEQRDARVLISAGIEGPARHFLLAELAARPVADLAGFLAVHPEVLARAARLRALDSAAESGAEETGESALPADAGATP